MRPTPFHKTILYELEHPLVASFFSQALFNFSIWIVFQTSHLPAFYTSVFVDVVCSELNTNSISRSRDSGQQTLVNYVYTYYLAICFYIF